MQHHGGFQHNTGGKDEAPGGRRAAPQSLIHHPLGWRVKPVPIRASSAAHGELWVPGQPCPMPPMVLRGPGGGPDGQQANLGLPEPSWGSGLVLAHQQHPKPPFQPLNQHHAAPPGAEPPPRLRLPALSASGSAGRTGRRSVTLGTGDTQPLTPSAPARPPVPQVGRGQPWVWRCSIPTGQRDHPDRGGKARSPRAPGVVGHCPKHPCQLTQPQISPQGSVTLRWGSFARC